MQKNLVCEGKLQDNELREEFQKTKADPSLLDQDWFALPIYEERSDSRMNTQRKKQRCKCWLNCLMGSPMPEKVVHVCARGDRLEFRMRGYGNVADLLHQVLEASGHPPKGHVARLQTDEGAVLRRALPMSELEATELHLVLRRPGTSSPCGCSLQATCKACDMMVVREGVVRIAVAQPAAILSLPDSPSTRDARAPRHAADTADRPAFDFSAIVFLDSVLYNTD